MKTNQTKTPRRKGQTPEKSTDAASRSTFRRDNRPAIVAQSGFRTIVCVSRSGQSTWLMLPSW